MKKLLLTGIAALLLATGTAHATSFEITVCGNKLVYIHGHHGYTYYQWIGDKERELPSKLFRRGNRLYFRGRKCQPVIGLSAPPALSGDPCAFPQAGKCGYPENWESPEWVGTCDLSLPKCQDAIEKRMEELEQRRPPK
jgi:hypothetical protein